MGIRTCLGCRLREDQSALTRIVARAGTAIVDEDQRLPGRGAWVHPTVTCTTRALRSLGRALRSEGLDTSPVADWAARLAAPAAPDEGTDRPMDT